MWNFRWSFCIRVCIGLQTSPQQIVMLEVTHFSEGSQNDLLKKQRQRSLRQKWVQICVIKLSIWSYANEMIHDLNDKQSLLNRSVLNRY